ncbi:MAG: hypothetical protein ACJ8FS_17065 [Sphingomicrobium sp.]
MQQIVIGRSEKHPGGVSHSPEGQHSLQSVCYWEDPFATHPLGRTTLVVRHEIRAHSCAEGPAMSVVVDRQLEVLDRNLTSTGSAAGSYQLLGGRTGVQQWLQPAGGGHP